jgi:hypothetical protein
VAAACGTRDGRANPSRFSTGKYSLRLTRPTIGSSRLRSASTESASQMQTARLPSGVGKVWWSLICGEMVFGRQRAAQASRCRAKWDDSVTVDNS